MRLISQDGSVDLSYKYVGISISAIDGTTIIAFPVSVTDDTYWNMATYSTEEKAKEVLKMLRAEYTTNNIAFNCPRVWQFPEECEV